MSHSVDPLYALVDILDGGTGDDSDGGVLELMRQLADALGRGDMPRTALALDATVDRLSVATKRAREHLELGDTAVLLVSDFDEPTVSLGADGRPTTPGWYWCRIDYSDLWSPHHTSYIGEDAEHLTWGPPCSGSPRP